MNIKEITVFSEGDSLDLNCWSNVPYCFTKALVNKGININRVNIYSNKYIRKTIWKYIFEPFLSLFYKGNIYTFEQTRLNRFFIKKRIRKALNKYKNSDLNIYMSYAYLEESKQPNILFSDWTSEYILKHRLERSPFSIEEKFLKIQRCNIEKADMVISLFPDIANTMREMYDGKTIFYLGQNVINNAYNGNLICSDILSLKKESNILLFIGRKGYIEGAKMLVRVFPSLKKIYPELELHIIGLSKNDFEKLPDDVICYGYLDKAKDNALYYDLLLKARCFVNPTSLWGGYSATVEAMFFYNPVIVSNYRSFVETFGEEIDFGFYVRNNSEEELYSCICKIMNNTDYEQLCLNAHKNVETFTWDNFVDKFLKQVEMI